MRAESQRNAPVHMYKDTQLCLRADAAAGSVIMSERHAALYRLTLTGGCQLDAVKEDKPAAATKHHRIDQTH